MHCTHSALHVRDVSDACVVFEAVRRGTLPLWKRRLNAAERESITAGNIFVWEEAEERGGLERWTDGRRWTQSRMRMDFLYYEETAPVSSREKATKTMRRSSNDDLPSPVHVSRRQDRPLRPDGLIKQTISTIVHSPGDHRPKKWHLVTYTALNAHSNDLPVIENYEYLRSIEVPPGVFTSSRGVSWARDRHQADSSNDSSSQYSISQPTSPIRTKFSVPPHFDPYACQPQNIAATVRLDSPSHLFGPSAPDLTAPPPPMVPTLVDAHRHQESSNNTTTSHRKENSSRPYVPLTSEDRRVLGAFQLRL